MRRTILLLLTVVIGSVTSLASAMALVPRVRTVEVATIFFSAFAAGASLVAAIHEMRQARRLR